MPSMIAPTCTIEGVAFGNVTMRETVSLILAMVQKGTSPHHICTGNIDHLYLLQSDAEFRDAYETASLILADGMPILWLSRLLPDRSEHLKERVAGSDLFWELARASQSTSLRLFFLGGAPGSATAAARAVEERYPGAQVVGTYCPPFETFATDEEQAKIREMIRAAEPDVLLVGLGAPKQEKWIAQNKAHLGVPVSIGVGGTFEMAGGVVKRAPEGLQKIGLEWAFRLVQDPARLYRRYICNDLPYLCRAAVRTIKGNDRRKQRESAKAAEMAAVPAQSNQSTSGAKAA
ncbi:MAG: WecB/TagA/CpsF family glycosyltransferase [Armatimonadaceae bacterium]